MTSGNTFRPQDHRTATKVTVLPVFGRVKQRAEGADLLLEGKDLIGDAIGSAVDDQFFADRLELDLVVRLVAAGLEQFDPAILLQLCESDR